MKRAYQNIDLFRGFVNDILLKIVKKCLKKLFCYNSFVSNAFLSFPNVAPLTKSPRCGCGGDMTSCCLIKVIVNTCLLSGNISVINFSFKDGDVSALTVSYARRGETLKCGSWALVLLFWHNWPFESPGGTSFSVPPGMILSRGERSDGGHTPRGCSLFCW